MKKACEEMPELVRAGGGKRSGRAAECGQTYEERRTYQNVLVFTRKECAENFLNWCVQEEGNARAELLSAVNADQAELVEELSREIEAVSAEKGAAAPARALLESRAAEAESSAAAAARETAAAKQRANELRRQVESLQVRHETAHNPTIP